MANFFKKLKVLNSQEGKVMTTDANGILVSSNKNVTDLADTATTNALDSRVTALEEAVEDVGQRLVDING